MSKRFTDTDKWERPWFRKLPKDYRDFWLYIVDKCDRAGIWYVDMELASFMVGANLDLEDALGFFDKQVEVLDQGARWFIVDFVSFQYGQLSPNSPAHTKVIDILTKSNLLSRVPNTLPHTLGTRVEEEEKEVVKTLSNKFTKPSFEELKAHLAEIKSLVDPVKFFNHYESNGWKVGRNPMKSWKAAIRTWERSDFNNNGKEPLKAVDPLAGEKMAEKKNKLEELADKEFQRLHPEVKLCFLR